MSYNTFPTFAGMAWDIKKRSITSTAIETAASGVEFRTSRWTAPLFEFDLTINYLSQADKVTLENFFAGQNGPLTPFYLSVPNDAGSPYLVRFLDDQLEVNQMMNQMYEVQGFTVRTVR